MCSLWMTTEGCDDGDLEAVVRGYSRMNPYNWPPAPAGIDPGLAFSALRSSSSSTVFPNLMVPGCMDLLDMCSPFYGNSNATVLRSAPLMFDSIEVQAASSPIFGVGADSPLAKLGEPMEENGSNSVEMNPMAPERLDVVCSKPVKAEPLRECDGSSSSLSQAADHGGSSQPPSKAQGSKRRKTQQKRIVCVPAAGGSNRPSGESLPSDLWAWRKYGQKPIKGSPYPRGYYRCSSSKGCSARKQVERSRTDPTMLVITYTSDHNHPWPTHRNALAGSTRQTVSEKNAQGGAESARTHKEENSEAIIMPENNNPGGDNYDSTGGAGSNSSADGAPADGENLSSSMIIEEEEQDPAAAELRNLFRPDDDFFAELGELPEPLNIFARIHFDDDKSDEEEAGSSVVDPFNLFNWSSPAATPKNSHVI